MSWKLIKEIQNETDLRLILPFGLNLKLGDVISVGKNGDFTLEGSSRSLLAMPAGKPRPNHQPGIDLTRTSGKDTKYSFRAAGVASSLFPELPAAKAGFDISFGSAESWLLAIVGRIIESLDELHRFRRPILDAYKSGVWTPDWALVTSVAKVDKMTLIASSSANTSVALSIGATVADTAAFEAKLTSDVSIVASNQQLIRCVIVEPAIAFCTALRVKDPWWRSPYVKTLESSVGTESSFAEAKDEEFWEDVDEL